jgi:hypothetical protein
MSRYDRTYNQYPQIWGPADVNPHLFVVKVPATIDHFDLSKYLELMEQRVQWMISQSIVEFGVTETQTSLINAIELVSMVQQYPTKPDDLLVWGAEWAATFIQHSEAFQQNEAMDLDWFPAKVIRPSMPEYETQQWIHAETQLEEWLNTLITPYL